MAFKMKRSPLKKGENIFSNIFKKASPEKIEARKQLKQRAKKSGVSTFEQRKLDKIAARRAKSKADKLKSKSSSTMPDPKNEIKVPGANKPSWQWDDVTKNVKVTPKVEEVVNKTGTTSYADYAKKGGDVDAAKKWNMENYGTHNPTARAKKLGISKSELSKQYKDSLKKKNRVNRVNKDITTVGHGLMQAIDQSVFYKKSPAKIYNKAGKRRKNYKY